MIMLKVILLFNAFFGANAFTNESLNSLGRRETLAQNQTKDSSIQSLTTDSQDGENVKESGSSIEGESMKISQETMPLNDNSKAIEVDPINFENSPTSSTKGLEDSLAATDSSESDNKLLSTNNPDIIEPSKQNVTLDTNQKNENVTAEPLEKLKEIFPSDKDQEIVEPSKQNVTLDTSQKNENVTAEPLEKLKEIFPSDKDQEIVEPSKQNVTLDTSQKNEDVTPIPEPLEKLKEIFPSDKDQEIVEPSKQNVTLDTSQKNEDVGSNQSNRKGDSSIQMNLLSPDMKTKEQSDKEALTLNAIIQEPFLETRVSENIVPSISSTNSDQTVNIVRDSSSNTGGEAIYDRKNPPVVDQTPLTMSNSSSDNNTAIALGVSAAVIVFGLFGVLFYRRRTISSKNTNPSDVLEQGEHLSDISDDAVSVRTTDTIPKITTKNPFKPSRYQVYF